MEGATGILLNVRGGKDLTLGQVHEVANVVRDAGNPRANVMFGVVQDRWMRHRARITVVATGLTPDTASGATDLAHEETEVTNGQPAQVVPAANGRVAEASVPSLKLV